ncbi:MAG: cyclic nucleotide-binding domain-containing protein, partial [Sphingomonadales bacterium]|nr:cyclic nucleotide-binding domain-containing protein [Sphingomonadales bacterium]
MLFRKLSRFVELSKAEREALGRFTRRTSSLARHDHLLREGDKPEKMHLLLEGWACRYKLLSDGKRQIFSYLVPGDLCDVQL